MVVADGCEGFVGIETVDFGHRCGFRDAHVEAATVAFSDVLGNHTAGDFNLTAIDVEAAAVHVRLVVGNDAVIHIEAAPIARDVDAAAVAVGLVRMVFYTDFCIAIDTDVTE